MPRRAVQPPRCQFPEKAGAGNEHPPIFERTFMKTLALLLLAALLPQAALAATVRSGKHEVNVGRVAELHRLSASSDDVKVQVVVQDLGGSTDVSPTQTVYFTLYTKGEMFSTNAAFEIANVLTFKSAKRVKKGVYEVTLVDIDEEGRFDFEKGSTYRIDARKAISAMEAVDCGGDFDCGDSENFAAEISVTRK